MKKKNATSVALQDWSIVIVNKGEQMICVRVEAYSVNISEVAYFNVLVPRIVYHGNLQSLSAAAAATPTPNWM